MANTMAAVELLLYDRAPGPIHWGALPAADSAGNHFTSNAHANVSATPAYEPGYKIGYQDKTNNGPCILAYMKYTAGSAACAIGDICSFTTGSSTVATWYTITNDGDLGMIAPCAYIALEVMTSLYWGWFWCGGVAPSDHISTFTADDTTILTDGNIIQESLLEIEDASSPDKMRFKIAATSYQAVGISFATDDT